MHSRCQSGGKSPLFLKKRIIYELSSSYILFFMLKIACPRFHFSNETEFLCKSGYNLGKSGNKQIRAKKEGIRAKGGDGLGSRAFRLFSEEWKRSSNVRKYSGNYWIMASGRVSFYKN